VQFFKNYSVDESLIELVSKVLIVEPEERYDALKVLSLGYFDEVRDRNLETKLVGIKFENLFNFSQSKKFLLFSLLIESNS